MKGSNKKRLENLERTKPTFFLSPIVIYDPADPPPENSFSGTGVRILIPDNRRQSKDLNCLE